MQERILPTYWYAGRIYIFMIYLSLSLTYPVMGLNFAEALLLLEEVSTSFQLRAKTLRMSLVDAHNIFAGLVTITISK